MDAITSNEHSGTISPHRLRYFRDKLGTGLMAVVGLRTWGSILVPHCRGKQRENWNRGTQPWLKIWGSKSGHAGRNNMLNANEITNVFCLTAGFFCMVCSH